MRKFRSSIIIIMQVLCQIPFSMRYVCVPIEPKKRTKAVLLIEN